MHVEGGIKLQPKINVWAHSCVRHAAGESERQQLGSHQAPNLTPFPKGNGFPRFNLIDKFVFYFSTFI